MKTRTMILASLGLLAADGYEWFRISELGDPQCVEAEGEGTSTIYVGVSIEHSHYAAC